MANKNSGQIIFWPIKSRSTIIDEPDQQADGGEAFLIQKEYTSLIKNVSFIGFA
jgi:hypothetical protein